MPTERRWLRGCAIGCGCAALLALGGCVALTLYLNRLVRGVEVADESYDTLIADSGDVETYVPPADGGVPDARLAVFLEIRESIDAPAAELEATLARLPPRVILDSDVGLPRKILAGFSAVRELIDGAGAYVAARNLALVEHRMGLGEYVYLYSLTYYSWLGHRPEERPSLGQLPEGEDGELFSGESPFDAPSLRRRHRRYLLTLLRRQLETLEGSGEAADSERRSRLAAEIRRFEGDPSRVPWQDGLPPAMESALEPHRERLAATYRRSTNCFELPLAEHEGPLQWTFKARD
jgi:hypothetical protein